VEARHVATASARRAHMVNRWLPRFEETCFENVSGGLSVTVGVAVAKLRSSVFILSLRNLGTSIVLISNKT
jgi:hypothetical protein